MTGCRWFFSSVLLLALATTAIFCWAVVQVGAHERSSGAGGRVLVQQLQLTDLAIWTEARYTRHPSQADLFTPFQEFPGALEHFPAGSLLAPPSFNLTTRLEVIPRSGAAP